MMIEMKVAGVTLDEKRRPVVVLKNGEKILPIWIDQSQAFSISTAMENMPMARPLTHDLILSILKGYKSVLQRVQVYKLEGGTYFANLILHQQLDSSDQTQVLKVDCRPSDALALAVRVSCPIFVAEEVLQQGGQDSSTLESGEEPEPEEDEESSE